MTYVESIPQGHRSDLTDEFAYPYWTFWAQKGSAWRQIAICGFNNGANNTPTQDDVNDMIRGLRSAGWTISSATRANTGYENYSPPA